MVKVALLLSGQPRFINSLGYKSIKENILNKYNCDVFCHFWWNPDGGEYITAPWSTLGKLEIPKNVDKDIKKLYHPKKIKWDYPLNPNNVKKIYSRSCHLSSSYNLPSMYLSMKQSYLLYKEYIDATEESYDFVIRLRYDAILTNFPDLNNLNNNYLYAPDYSHYHNGIGNNGLILSPKNCDIIMCIYDYIDEIYSQGCLFNDEQLVKQLLNWKNINYKILPYSDFYIELCRKNT